MFNQASKSAYVRNTCNQNVGKLTGEGGSFTLDDHRFHELVAGGKYTVDYCGIPWERTGKMAFTFDYSEGFEIYTSGDYIVFENMKTNAVDRKEKVPPNGRVSVAISESGGKLVLSIN